MQNLITDTPAYIESFCKVAVENNIPVEQAAAAYHRERVKEACAKDPLFRKGFERAYQAQAVRIVEKVLA